MSKKVAPPPARRASAANPPKAATGRSPEAIKAAATPLNQAPRVEPTGPRKVRALKMGYYDHVRRREGDVFILNDPANEFSSKWMEYVDARTPTKVTTGAEDLRKKHDEILGASAPDGLAAHDEADHATGDLKVLGE
jgi:hypothetical protein